MSLSGYTCLSGVIYRFLGAAAVLMMVWSSHSAVEVTAFSFTFGGAAKKTSSESSTQSTIPSSGFIRGNSDGNVVVFHTMGKINRLSDCETIEFQNIPADIGSPLMGSPRFTAGEYYNNRRSWSNGKEFLSFVEPGTEGTWILGVEPGVDAGYVYLKPTFPTLTPADASTDDAVWHWNVANKWVAMPDVKVTCVDTASTSATRSSFYEVEYYDVSAQHMENSFLKAEANGNYAFLRKADNSWVTVSQMSTVCELGGAVGVADNKGTKKFARLVNSEHTTGGWRITLRFTDDVENQQNYNSKSEVLLDLLNNGDLSDGFSIKELSQSEKDIIEQGKVASVAGLNVGDFIWVWVEDLTYLPRNGPQALSYLAPLPILPSVQRVEVLLKCIDHSTVHNKWTFHVHHSDRRDAMAQTMLGVDTDFYTFTLSNASKTIQVAFEEAADRDYSLIKDMNGLVVIGSDPVAFLRKYIVDKEGVLSPDVSSCYLYHAAVSVPQQFVYAIEIICVLMGAKPATMVRGSILPEYIFTCGLCRFSIHLIQMRSGSFL
jgi:hypothetical protein